MLVRQSFGVVPRRIGTIERPWRSSGVFAPAISQPTLLIAAQKDDITPIEAERHLQTLFPDADLVEIPEVGHLIHYETPQAAASAVTRFLRPSGGDTP